MLYRVHCSLFKILILFLGPPKNCFIYTASSVGGIYSLHDLNQWLAMEKFLLIFLPQITGCIVRNKLTVEPDSTHFSSTIVHHKTRNSSTVAKQSYSIQSFASARAPFTFGSHFNRKPNGTYLTRSPIITSISSL